jgi:hypothetical protein
MRQCTFSLGTFPLRVTLMLGDPGPCARALRRKHSLELDFADDLGGFTVPLVQDDRPPPFYLVWLRPAPWTTLVANLAHEASHVVDFVFEYLEIPPGPGSTETRAYMAGFIVEKGLSLLDIKGRKK